ncbi:Hpt domain-containing protein [Shewanella sp. UCD-KL21]|uniref:Hpt domain-containing protein n=1 Tax=Shewanella sp. UCD-KL21 TaxID=1917164 RepID=UPI000970D367|nr:Hpt domain-containing protein [Shewanella sp. UCD-KL21]
MINITALSDMFDGDIECVKELLGLYLECNADAATTIEAHYSTQDTEALFHVFHTLSGSLSNLCEEDAVPLIREAEGISKRGEMPSRQQIDVIQQHLSKIAEQVSLSV